MRADFKIIRHCVFQARQALSINVRADYIDLTHKKVSNVVEEDSFFLYTGSHKRLLTAIATLTLLRSLAPQTAVKEQ